MLKKNLKLEDPQTAELRAYFWGGWDAYRVELAMGRDLILNPAQQGAPLNSLGYPYAEVGGEPLDFYDPASFKYSFTTYTPSRAFITIYMFQLFFIYLLIFSGVQQCCKR